MRSLPILILSDLHLGNGAGYDIFAGATELPAFLDSFSEPIHLVLNGDGVDFLMNEDELTLQVDRAVQQAHAIADFPETRRVWEAFGRILERGGEVSIRVGNHDVELCLPEVQAVFREALGQPEEVALRANFLVGAEPMLLSVGKAKLLVTHGEQNDSWNRLDYGSLLSCTYDDFAYPPGSNLVKNLLNPLKRQYGLRFADLIKPDMQGGFLTVLGVAPAAAQQVALSGKVIDLAWQLFRNSFSAFTFGEEQPQDLGLADRLDAAGLSAEERAYLEGLFSDQPASFGEEDNEGMRQKLVRNGLMLYARAHRALVGSLSNAFFALEAEEGELTEAQRLIQKYGVHAVFLGHTHAARWAPLAEGLYVNTGTWIWLMAPPSPEASPEEWAAYIENLRENPGLKETDDASLSLRAIFTAALVEPAEEKARVSLLLWRNGSCTELGSTLIG